MKQPTVYEINTPIFINEASRKAGERLTFATIPDATWDEIASYGADMVWFMGIWKRSAAAREMALSEAWLRESFSGVEDEDIIGSAYSIQEYVVDEAYGGDDALAIARTKLKERGMGLMLDYVPNHVGLDHAWAAKHPEYLVGGTEAELVASPKAFIKTPGGVIAWGKDPNFAPWSDVLQINAYSEPLRAAVAELLQHIATMCDAVRCDMAMLMMNDIFKETWGTRAGEPPAQEYWPPIVQAVKAQRPDFIFLAEVYWGKEDALIKQGFDFCYDKELYDDLLNGSARDIRKRLLQPIAQQQHLMRFIENHDEERAATSLPAGRHEAAAVIASTLPGMRLFHDGQFEGRKTKLPVHLGRREGESTNDAIKAFYSELAAKMELINFETDGWQLLETRTGLFPHESTHLLAWAWTRGGESLVVAVNYSDETASAKLHYLYGKEVTALAGLSGDSRGILRNSIVTLRPWQAVFISTATQ